MTRRKATDSDVGYKEFFELTKDADCMMASSNEVRNDTRPSKRRSYNIRTHFEIGELDYSIIIKSSNDMQI